MISRNRSAPTTEAMSIEWTTSAKRTVTCLYSAWVSASLSGEPQLWQKRAFSRGSVPHVRHAATVVIRPSADPGPQRFQGSSKDRPLHTPRGALSVRGERHQDKVLRPSYVVYFETPEPPS